MTEPEPAQDDLTADDHLAELTDNGWKDSDPIEQPSQDPADLPEGTETLLGVVDEGQQ